MTALSLVALSIDASAILPSTLRVTDVTTGALDGTGIFDRLMQTVALHVEDEFTKGRITGKDYATVYLGAMTGVLQASIQFLTQDKQIEKLNAEIGLLRQKTVTELTSTADAIPVGLGFNSNTDVEGTTDRQQKLYEAQTAGFSRDAEQKLTKILVDTWSARRMTDDGTVASSSNGLDDATILQAINKAKSGIGLT